MARSRIERPERNSRVAPGIQTVIVIFAATVLAASMTSSPAQAQVQWAQNGHFYEFVTNKVHWTAAKAAAEMAVFNGLQGHLATISSQEENDFILSSFAAMGFAWIGLTDAISEGSFRWVTSEPLVFTDWAPGEPNNAGAGEDFVEFDTIGGLGWNDIANDNDGGRFYIIEYEPGVEAPSMSVGAIVVLALGLAGAARWQLRRRSTIEI